MIFQAGKGVAGIKDILYDQHITPDDITGNILCDIDHTGRNSVIAIA